MEKQNEERLLMQVAQMYYLENKNQSEISKELDIHRTTISRLLKRCREEGIVNISINYDYAGTYTLEKKLEEKFTIKKAIVVSVTEEQNYLQIGKAMGKAASTYLAQIVEDNMKIGFSWGASLAALVLEMEPLKLEGIVCLPMIGGPAGKLESQYHVNTISYEAAKKLNGKSLMIDSPAISETEDLRNALIETKFNQEISEIWNELDMAIFGIGSPSISNTRTWRAFYGEETIDMLKEKDVAGDILSRFFDSQGEKILTNLDRKLIGIDLQQLKKVPIRIGIAESLEKVKGIYAALQGGYLTTLVTTEETAKALIQLDAELSKK